MAWISFQLENTLVQMAPPEVGGGLVPIPGAIETVTRYSNEGHKLTVQSFRLIPMPDSEKFRVKKQIETELSQMGFPPMEVWTGTTKPMSDFHVSHDAVTFDGDYNLLQAQLDYMMNERGLTTPSAGPEDQEL